MTKHHQSSKLYPLLPKESSTHNSSSIDDISIDMTDEERKVHDIISKKMKSVLPKTMSLHDAAKKYAIHCGESTIIIDPEDVYNGICLHRGIFGTLFSRALYRQDWWMRFTQGGINLQVRSYLPFFKKYEEEDSHKPIHALRSAILCDHHILSFSSPKNPYMPSNTREKSITHVHFLHYTEYHYRAGSKRFLENADAVDNVSQNNVGTLKAFYLDRENRVLRVETMHNFRLLTDSDLPVSPDEIERAWKHRGAGSDFLYMVDRGKGRSVVLLCVWYNDKGVVLMSRRLKVYAERTFKRTFVT